MNQMTVGGLSGERPRERPSPRALAKQRTREKILAAAKRLFTERGYEGATVRDIASAAGMSTGAVFASFTDKSDLFAEIAGADQEALLRSMQAAAEGRAPKAAIEAILDVAAQRHMADLPLLHATMSALWSQELGKLMRKRLGRPPALELMAAALKAGAARGDITAEADPDLLAGMLWGSYIAALRRTVQEGHSLERLRRLVREQVEFILAAGPRN